MTKPLRPDRPMSNTDRVAAKVSLVAGATLTVLLLGLHLVEPEYDPTWRFVSEYALGHAGWMMTLAFGEWTNCPTRFGWSTSRPHTSSRWA